MFTNPLNAIVIETLQITRLVIADEKFDDTLLASILSNTMCLFQPIDNMLNSIAVATINFPYVFLDNTIALDKRCIQSMRQRT